MRILLHFFFLLFFIDISAQKTWSLNNLWPTDWLVDKVTRKSQAIYYADKKEITLYNGLVKRTFRLLPNAACIDYKNMITGQQPASDWSKNHRRNYRGRRGTAKRGKQGRRRVLFHPKQD